MPLMSLGPQDERNIKKAQTSLRIRADWSAPFLFAFLESFISKVATREIKNF